MAGEVLATNALSITGIIIGQKVDRRMVVTGLGSRVEAAFMVAAVG
jgi:hypothetical protein